MEGSLSSGEGSERAMDGAAAIHPDAEPKRRILRASASLRTILVIPPAVASGMGHNLKTTLYEGDWLRLVKIGHWESCRRTHGQGMAVIVIAVTPADEVLFVEQYRVPLGARTIRCQRAWSATTMPRTPWPTPHAVNC